MNPRFISLLIVLFFVGAGLYLVLRPSEPTVAPTPAPSEQSTPPRTDSTPTRSDAFFILAVSWQPAFCETQPSKPECRAQRPDTFEASNFTLHGLWPQGEYCGVSTATERLDRDGRWSDLPPVELSPDLRDRLDEAMPGTRSQLDRHEWIKHGTCFGDDAEAYYAASLSLLEQLNGSPARRLFADNVGRRLTQSQIRATFDRAFGAGAGERVRVACDQDGDRTLVTELTLGLWGSIGPNPDLPALLAAARPTRGGCEGGIVDPVGLQ